MVPRVQRLGGISKTRKIHVDTFWIFGFSASLKSGGTQGFFLEVCGGVHMGVCRCPGVVSHHAQT